MDKFSQDRGLLNKIREKSNISGRILESLNPEFSEMMERLRTTDDKIRSHASQIKDAVRAAKSHLNRRDYLASAMNISMFHERCRWISMELNRFIKSVDMKHYKFLLDQFDDEEKEKLFGYNPNYEIKPDDEISFVDDKIITAALQKQAGVSDWWHKVVDPIEDVAHNLTTGRGVAMRAFEKKFSVSFLKELKANTIVMVVRTQKFLQILLTIFKRLGTALAKRNVDQYIQASKVFISKFSEFHDQFVKYYQKSIVPLKQQNDNLIEEKRLAEQEKSRQIEEAAKNMQQSSSPSQQVINVSPTSTQQVPNLVSQVEKDKALENLRKNLGNEDDNIPLDLKKIKSNFIFNIEKLAESNDPKPLVLALLKFSERLEDVNLDESLKLLAIAEGIVDDYKSAGIFDFLKEKPGNQNTAPNKPANDIETKKETEVPLA